MNNDRARELVEKLRAYRGGTVEWRVLMDKAADFIEQALTPPEGDTVSEAIEPLLRFHETGGHEGDGSDERLALIRAALQSPTISDTAGIENALWEYLALLGRRLPDGGIAVHSVVHVPSLARAVIAALQSRVSPQAGMREALEDLQQAEAEYRLMHDRHGDGSQAAGRAWDLMRRAGDKARALLDAALATAPIPMSENHLAQRQQDEYFCARCKKRWSIGEEAPPCQ